MTPRPTSHTGSRTRSLISRRDSTSSSTLEHNSDPPVPEVPKLDGAHEQQHEKDSEVKPQEAAEKTEADAPKSPLLASHRISVTSMDDVSLEEGNYFPRL